FVSQLKHPEHFDLRRCGAGDRSAVAVAPGVRDRRGDGDGWLVRYRVRALERRGVQPDEGHDARRFGGAVLHVVADGRAGVAQRRADLVPPAAVRQRHLEERFTISLGHDVVARRGQLPARRHFEARPITRLLIEHGERPARRRLRSAAGRRPHRVDEDGAGTPGHAVDDGEVALVDAAVGERLRQARRSFTRGRHQHAAGHGPVEPVRRVRVLRAAALREKRLGVVRDARVAGAVALGQHARRLVEREDVVVLVQHAAAEDLGEVRLRCCREGACGCCGDEEGAAGCVLHHPTAAEQHASPCTQPYEWMSRCEAFRTCVGNLLHCLPGAQRTRVSPPAQKT
ncbi:unnamed protein product, partial [Pelagomonas calceolata]